MKVKLRIKEYRLRAGLTQQQLAQVVGVDRSTMSYYESGKAQPSLAVLVKIARVLNATLDEIVCD